MATSISSKRRLRQLPGLLVVLSMLIALIAPVATVSAASATGAAFTAGGTLVGGVYYTKSGSTLTLVVTTDNTTECVELTGAHTVVQKSDTAKTTWTFSLTANSGSGLQTVTATAFKKAHASQPHCIANGGEALGVVTASYVLDNIAPTTSANAPTTWSKTDVTVTLTASDAGGSGVAQTSYRLNGGTPQSGTSVTVTTTGVNLLQFWSVDNAGNIETTKTTQVLIDKTAPSITGSRSPAANANGWNNTNVTVSFTCDDTSPSSGITSCAAPTILSNSGANQSVTGTAADGAGNSASATVSGINIDKVAPTLSGTPTTNANAAGWHNGDVTIAWTAADALSGLTGTPANSTISGEGMGLFATASITDKAGNTTTANSSPVNIDRTAPTTGISGVSNFWVNGAVTVMLSPVDPLSGVATTSYTVDGGGPQNGTSFSLSTEGDHTVTFFSADKAGNAEAVKTVHVKIDLTAPTITHSFTPSSYTDSAWTNQDVTVTFECGDQGGSGVASCAAPVTKTAEGAGQQVVGSSADNAGNSASDTATVNIDKTAPTISGSADRAANANGWHNVELTVTFTCDDALSGVSHCPQPESVGEGADQSVAGTATDAAGNSANAEVTHINIDTTNPTITGAPSTTNWSNGDVTVTWTCGDNLSGLASACPPATTVSGEGDNLSASQSVSDMAGNMASATVSGIEIDRTAPTSAASVPAPLESGWYAGPVQVTLTATDNLSGVAKIEYRVDGGAAQTYSGPFNVSAKGVHTITFRSTDIAGNVEQTTGSVTLKIDDIAPTTLISLPASFTTEWNAGSVPVAFSASDAESGVKATYYRLDGGEVTEWDRKFVVVLDGDHTITFWSEDVAGNVEDNTAAANTYTIKVDTVPPTITGSRSPDPNSYGWNNSAVTVHFDCADGYSGINVEAGCPADTVVNGEGESQSVTGTATDNAGHTNSATVEGISIDLTAPMIHGEITSGPNAFGWARGDVTVHWICDDALSGIDSCPTDTTVVGEGDYLSASQSVKDRAGNLASAEVAPIKIDRAAPVTTATAPAEWNNADVTVSLAAIDILSGVLATYYTLDGGATTQGGSVVVTGEGVHTITFWSVDKAGNEEAHTTVEVKIDLTKPTITHTQSPEANANGWNNTSVTVTFTCNDEPSGIASCADPKVVSTDGQNQTVTGTATDKAGNTASDEANLNIDTTSPSIAGAPDRTPNANGWYAANVSVNFTCVDSLSGIEDCSEHETFGEGGNQTATGTATDRAGNDASFTVGGINVDKTRPTITGSRDQAANGNGWHNADVIVSFDCDDALSGVDACTSPQSLGEGEGQSVTGTAIDNAGNTEETTISGINVDKTAPNTTAAAPPTDWSNSSVTVSLTATDSLSGVESTHFTVDAGTVQTGTSVPVAGQGVHTIEYWSIDKAGNAETHRTVKIKIDLTAPTITGAPDRAANASGWYNADVTVGFTCDDQGGSGLASCAGPQTVSTEGADQSVTGTATDNAGNTASGTVKVSVDKTGPTITGSPDRSANSNGWYNADVTVGFTCQDELSGIDACAKAQTLGEGANQSVTGTATDAAGNNATDTVSGINIDQTGPTISGSATTAANANGWHNSDVTVNFTCDDTLSGIAACADQRTLGEGKDQSVSGAATDRAGNSTTTSVNGINVDKTAPTIDGSATTSPNANGWHNSDVTITWACTDALSGIVAGACPAAQTITGEGANLSAGPASVSDNAGNSATATVTGIQIDRTAPTISGSIVAGTLGANGWYIGPVTVRFACGDSLSGVANCPADVTLSANGANQSVSGTVIDKAGNTSSVTVGNINIDTTGPGVTITGVVNGAVYTLGAVPAASCTAADNTGGSGLSAACAGTLSGGTANGVGTFIYTATAKDKAGNTTTASVSYRVVYRFEGFLQPINDTAHQVGTSTSVFKAGSTIPVKFQLKRADGTVVQAAGVPQWVTPSKGSPTTAPVDESLYTDPASTGGTYKYDGTAQQYIYNWSTKGVTAGYYYRIGVTFDDGQTYYVNIGLR